MNIIKIPREILNLKIKKPILDKQTQHYKATHYVQVLENEIILFNKDGKKDYIAIKCKNTQRACLCAYTLKAIAKGCRLKELQLELRDDACYMVHEGITFRIPFFTHEFTFQANLNNGITLNKSIMQALSNYKKENELNILITNNSISVISTNALLAHTQTNLQLEKNISIQIDTDIKQYGFNDSCTLYPEDKQIILKDDAKTVMINKGDDIKVSNTGIEGFHSKDKRLVFIDGINGGFIKVSNQNEFFKFKSIIKKFDKCYRHGADIYGIKKNTIKHAYRIHEDIREYIDFIYPKYCIMSLANLQSTTTSQITEIIESFIISLWKNMGVKKSNKEILEFITNARFTYNISQEEQEEREEWVREALSPQVKEKTRFDLELDKRLLQEKITDLFRFHEAKEKLQKELQKDFQEEHTKEAVQVTQQERTQTKEVQARLETIKELGTTTSKITEIKKSISYTPYNISFTIYKYIFIYALNIIYIKYIICIYKVNNHAILHSHKAYAQAPPRFVFGSGNRAKLKYSFT